VHTGMSGALTQSCTMLPAYSAVMLIVCSCFPDYYFGASRLWVSFLCNCKLL
jgi:hypothetical protein